jgi:hypothetical protein
VGGVAWGAVINGNRKIAIKKMIGNVETFFIYRERDETFRNVSFNNSSNTG